jgi:hypothetical protein
MGGKERGQRLLKVAWSGKRKEGLKKTRAGTPFEVVRNGLRVGMH